MALPSGPQGQLQEFLFILSKRRWQIILPAAFVITAGVVFSVIAPRKYRVTSRIEIRESRIEHDPQFHSPQASATEREIDNAEHHIRHFERIKEIIEQNIEEWPRYLNADTRERNDFIRKKIIRNLDVAVQDRPRNQGSTFVDIAYTDVNPVRAVSFLQQITQVWIDEVIQRDRKTVQKELDILQNEVAAAQGEFNSLNAQFIDLAKQMEIDPTQPLGVARIERATDPYYTDLQEIDRERQDVTTELAEIEGQLEDLRAQRADTEPEQEVAETVGGLGFDQEVRGMEARILDLKQQQAPLKPAHSKWSLFEREIRELERQIEEARALETTGKETLRREPNPQYTALVAQIDEATTQVAGLRRKLDSLTERQKQAQQLVYKRTDDYRELIVLNEKRKTAATELDSKKNALAAKQMTMKIITEAWAKPYEVVEPPTVPEKPDQPNVLLILTFSVIAGVGVGLALAMVSEFGRPGYRSVGELSQVMTVPVLGTINRIVTRREGRRTRRRQIAVGLASVVLIGGLLWVTYLWHARPEMLPTEVIQAIDDFQFKLI